MTTSPAIRSRTIQSRAELLGLLCEAAELEHGIACSYLYAAFSLKHDLAEGGMTWEEQQTVRRWAGQIYFIASQEMLHLALVWNLTTAIGGTPYCLRPNFPQASSYYPLDVPIALEPFGAQSLRRFILYEHPHRGSEARDLRELFHFPDDDASAIEFGSVAELYALIASGFHSIDEKSLFVGTPTQQMTPDLVHFPDLVAVVDRASALRAIGEITRQGEGSAHDRLDSHLGAFIDMLAEFRSLEARGAGFAPARPALANPSARLERAYSAHANPLEDERAQQVAALFDSVYGLMMRMLAWAFEFDAQGKEDELKSLCGIAIDLMPRVLMPLGEGLMQMPAGARYPGKTAGPGFGVSRQVMLPPNPGTARRLCTEELSELAALAAGLPGHTLPASVQTGCRNLRQIDHQLRSKGSP
jgi:hypothetical protein